MEDTSWFEEKSEDEKLSWLSQRMYSGDWSAKTDFKTLINFVPVDLVNTGQNQAPQKRGESQRFLEIMDFQVTTKDVREYGTLLQDAVCEEKLDFIRMLLEYGCV